MNKKIILSTTITLLSLPVLVLASSPTDYATPLNVVKILTNLINLLWMIFFGLSILAFIYAGILFVWGGSNSSKLGEAKNVVIYASIGAAVALIGFSIQSIVESLLF